MYIYIFIYSQTTELSWELPHKDPPLVVTRLNKAYDRATAYDSRTYEVHTRTATLTKSYLWNCSMMSYFSIR